MLAQDGKLSAASLAETIGITPKAIEKHLAKLKAEGIIQRAIRCRPSSARFNPRTHEGCDRT